MSNILTIEGQYFDFENPQNHKYDVKETSHALSHICRYTGHCKKFYPVSQHAVYVSYIVPPEDANEGLHHDDSEAYLGDVSSPLKALLPDYKLKFEIPTEAAIAEQMGLRFPYPSSVKQADMRVLISEKVSVMPLPVAGAKFVKWPPFEAIPGLNIKPVSPWMAKWAYLDRHVEINGGGTWFQKLRLKLGLTPLTVLKRHLPSYRPEEFGGSRIT